MNLQQKAMVVVFSQPQYPRYISLRGTGEKVGHEVGAKLGTTKDNKQELFKLWDGLKDLRNEFSKAYTYWKTNSVSWEDGKRLVPNCQVLDHLKELGKYRSNIEAIKQRIAPEYEHEIEKDIRVSRGDIAKREDYPATADEFLNRFQLNIHPRNIENPQDIRAMHGIEPDEAEKMVQSAVSDLSNKLAEGVKELVNELLEPVQHFENRLNEGSFKKNSIENVLETVQRIKKLNITNNDSLNEYLDDVLKGFQPMDAELIRKVPEYKEEAKKKTKDLIEKMKCFV